MLDLTLCPSCIIDSDDIGDEAKDRFDGSVQYKLCTYHKTRGADLEDDSVEADKKLQDVYSRDNLRFFRNT